MGDLGEYMRSGKNIVSVGRALPFFTSYAIGQPAALLRKGRGAHRIGERPFWVDELETECAAHFVNCLAENYEGDEGHDYSQPKVNQLVISMGKTGLYQ